MRIADVTEMLEVVAPQRWAEEWDSVGLQVGCPHWEVSTCLVTLDTTPAVVQEARELGAELVIAHHPLIRQPLGSLAPLDMPTIALWELVRAGIGLYVAHTNLDAAPGVGTGAALADALGLAHGEPLIPLGEGEGGSDGEMTHCAAGFGMIVELSEPMTPAQIMQWAGEALGTRMRLGVGDKPCRRIALFPGAAGAAVEHALAGDVDCLVCGELNYHGTQAAVYGGLGVVQLGHYGTEQPVVRKVCEYLSGCAGDHGRFIASGICTDPYGAA